MSDRPITPITRIIPAGAPLPDRGPLPGEAPPWWERPARPGPPAPPVPPPPIVPAAPPAPEPPPAPVPHVHVHVVMPYEAPPEPTRWQRLTAWACGFGRPWQIAGALLLTVLPIPGTHYSAMTTATYATAEARAKWGIPTGYALALIPLAWACARTRRHPTLARLCVVAIFFGGLLGAIEPFDLVTAYTGVHR